MKKIFIVTSYYPPEIGAAANRIQHMAEGLVNSGFDVTVITPLPNYPTGKIFRAYRGKRVDYSKANGVQLVRLWLYASNSKNKILRLIAMLSYSCSLMWFYIFNKVPNTVIIQSPPLLVAFTSMLFLNRKRRKIVLNVSDLWPLAGLELGALNEGFFVGLLKRVERYNYRNADLLLGQSNEILDHIHRVVPGKTTFLYRNYPEFHPIIEIEQQASSSDLNLVYAGLLGVAQGVFEICKSLDYKSLTFHIFGDGAERKTIEDYIAKNPHLPIHYYGKVDREALHKRIAAYDLAIIPLKKRIYGSVPSKIFEYAKLGLPVLYFGGGEGEDIIRDNDLGIVVEPTNIDHLNFVLNKIKEKPFSEDYKGKIKSTAFVNFDLVEQLNRLIKVL